MEMLLQVCCHFSCLVSSVDRCAGPSTDSGGKPAKTETKKKGGPTRKGKGKTKIIDGWSPLSFPSNYSPYPLTDDEVQEAEKPKAKPASKRKGRPPKPKAHPGTSLLITFYAYHRQYFI